MESESIVLGRINKKKVYLNDGKYGHYLTYESKNYKVPEWFPVDKIDIDIAERLIEYKKKMSELFLTDSKKPIKTTKKDQPHSGDMPSGRDSESDEEEAPKTSKKKI